VHHATEEQHQTEQMVQQLREIENDLFPRPAQAVDAQRLEELGRAFADARDAELGRGAHRES
jgi:hypothetical protein